jgi:anti-sigma B factor antagonist
MAVKVHSSESHDIAFLEIKGDVDMSASPEVQRQLVSYFRKNKKALIVDLSGVSYMDSSGIAVLVEGLQWGHNNKRKFRLTGLTPPVKDIFEIAHLLKVFEIYDSREDALRDITGA